MVTTELCIAPAGPPRFASMALISTTAGGFASLLGFAQTVPSSGLTLFRTFTSSSPKGRLTNGLALLYPQSFLRQTSFDSEKQKEIKNAAICGNRLILRGQTGQNMGMPRIPLVTVFRQALAVATHSVSMERLASCAHESFNGGQTALVVTGNSDMLVHPSNSTKLQKGLSSHFFYT
jgi:hypothetical protein